MSTYHPITVYKGSTFEFVLSVRKYPEFLLEETEIISQIREVSGTFAASFTITKDTSSQSLIMTLPSGTSSAVNTSQLEYQYDVIAVLADGDVVPIARGPIYFIERVSIPGP